MKLRTSLLILGITFATTLAAIVGQRLSSQALAVILGVVAGVAASVPTSLIVAWIAMRSASVSLSEEPRSTAPAADPRVVVIPAQFPAYAASYAPPMPEVPSPFGEGHGARRCTVIGDDAS